MVIYSYTYTFALLDFDLIRTAVLIEGCHVFGIIIVDCFFVARMCWTRSESIGQRAKEISLVNIKIQQWNVTNPRVYKVKGDEKL